MLRAEFHFLLCRIYLDHYAECHYAECHGTDCKLSVRRFVNSFAETKNLTAFTAIKCSTRSLHPKSKSRKNFSKENSKNEIISSLKYSNECGSSAQERFLQNWIDKKCDLTTPLLKRFDQSFDKVLFAPNEKTCFQNKSKFITEGTSFFWACFR